MRTGRPLHALFTVCRENPALWANAVFVKPRARSITCNVSLSSVANVFFLCGRAAL